MEIITIKKKVNSLSMNKDPEIFGEKFEILLDKFARYIDSNFKMCFVAFAGDDIVKVKIYEENKIIQAQIDIKTEYFRRDITNIVSIVLEMIEVIKEVIK